MAGSAWNTFAAGQLSRSADVNSNFDWLEGSIVPMSNGSTTDSVHDLGTSTAYWRAAWVNALNPTTTARGIAIGTTSVANQSDVVFEIAGSRTFIVSRVSSAQEATFAPINGMVHYNSTTNKFRGYQNGGWINMAGTPIGLIAQAQTSSAAGATATLMSITGSGRILGMVFNVSASSVFNFVIDSVTSGSLSATGLQGVQFQQNTTTGLAFTTTAGITSLGTFFKTNFQVYVTGIGNTSTVTVLYEKD